MTPKTRPTEESVTAFINAAEPETRRNDGWTVAQMMERITGAPAQMWGTSIVGFGSYTSINSTKKPAEWPLTGFSPRKTSLSIYIMPGFSPYEDLMARLGKYTTGKSCLYVKRLEDIDLDVLEELVTRSVADMRKKYETR